MRLPRIWYFNRGWAVHEPFFVVTTGRSGSVSLAMTLSQHPYVCAIHEPWLHLIPRAYDRLLMAQDAEDTGPNFFRTIVPVPAGSQRIGIVDHKLMPFIGDLHKAFGAARFAWLVRDGRDVVASAEARGWYTDDERANPGHIWAKYRICGDAVGAMSKDEWLQLSPFERCCWYWAWWNESIQLALQPVAQELWARFRLEDLARPRGMGRLQAFLRIPGMEVPELWHANKGLAGHRSADWTRTERESFEEFCGEAMDTWYPEWRKEDV